jgi:DNA-binding CsgD family transcriptional regulator
MPGQTAAERDEAGPPVMSAPRFTGRKQELAALTAALAGPPAVMLVEGEAGIGKTRLVSEVLASPAVKTRTVLLACCPPFGQPHTLGPVADALRQASTDVAKLRLSALGGALRPLFPEWAAALPAAPEPAEDATAARSRLFGALAELLDRLGVTVLVVEDAHWADEATLEFLLFLACRQPRRVSLLVTCRPEDVPAGSLLSRLSRHAGGSGGLRLAVGGLTVSETAGLVSSMLVGTPVSGGLAAFLHERTDGVPLAVEESVRLMAARGDVFCRDGELVRRQLADIAVPPTVRSLVLERAGRLSRAAQAVLSAAAVLTAPAGERIFRAVSGLGPEQTRAGLCAGLACGLLAEDTRGLVSFRHVLAARAVYESVPGPRRKVMHLRAGQALEQVSPPPVDRLARHFREAGDTGKWCRYAEQAADLALVSGDEATASALLQDLVVNAGLPARTVAQLTSKITFTTAAEPARCEDLVRALRSVLDRGKLKPAEEAEVRAQLGRVLLVNEDWPAGFGELERAAPHLRPGSAAAAQVMMMLSWPQGVIRPVPVHLRWLRRAPVVTEPLQPGQRLDLLACRATGLLALGVQDGWAEAARVPCDAATARERLDLAFGNLNIGETAVIWGRYGEARRRQAAALELAERDHYARCRSTVLAQQAHLDWFTGAWDGLAGRASALASDENLSAMHRLAAELVTGLLHAVTGSPGRAEHCLRRVHAGMCRRAGLESLEPAAALARLALAGGDAGEALRLTDACAEIVSSTGFWWYATELVPARVDALVTCGRLDEAAGLVTAFGRGLRGCAAPAPQAALATCQAIVTEGRGGHARAATAFARAAAAWQALPRPYDALLAGERRARCLLAAGRTQAALAQLAEVRDGLIGLGAATDAGRVERDLRRHGVEQPRRGGRRGYRDQLSPRELEVVRLLLAGQTRREIAHALFRSPKTIDAQLRSAMGKLGVTSRPALAVRAVEAGIAPGPQAATGR